jgi:hypothetical protein
MMARGHGEKLPRKQEQAIAALLAQPTVAEAARAAGVAERTLRNWLRLRHFMLAYRRARGEVVEAVVARLQRLGDKALDTLESGMASRDQTVALRAAVAVLRHAFQGAELVDVLARVDDLEQWLRESGGYESRPAPPAPRSNGKSPAAPPAGQGVDDQGDPKHPQHGN